MKFGEKILINDTESLLSKYKNIKETIWMNTNNKDIKVVVFGKETSKVLIVIKKESIKKVEYSKYTLRDLLDNEIEYEGEKYLPIGILSNEDFVDGKYSTQEHLAMEIIDEFKGKGIANELFRVKESIDGILSKSSEKIVSNIYMLLKNGYKVVGKIDPETGKEIPFKGQKFIEKIISIKIKKGEFDSRLDTSYVFEKE